MRAEVLCSVGGSEVEEGWVARQSADVEEPLHWKAERLLYSSVVRTRKGSLRKPCYRERR